MENQHRSPEEMLAILMENDAFSKWLGLEDIQVELGRCSFFYTIKEEMINGLGTVHGGVLFSAADSALAFASNSIDNLSVALEVSISFTKAVRINERLKVTAEQIYSGKKTAVFDIKTWNANEELVCFFKGTVYKTGKRIGV